MLDKQLAVFLEQYIAYGLTSQLTSVMTHIGNYQHLQDADSHVLFNLFAGLIKSFPIRDDRGRSAGISFLKNAMHSIVRSNRFLSLFNQTIRKLDSEDAVLCLWLFLQTASVTLLRQGLAAKYNEHMSAGSIVAAVGFLGRNPKPVFFPLRAILRLDEEAERVPAETRERYQSQGRHRGKCQTRGQD